ncbi:hypothetical protein HUT16_05520 [Kitasatospora sp. NA04385]|uniref:hypothetical protein n=1 Tax=Kitasatospora sp. NA04385 TaxID=2742135 RepID=UPI0015910C80|nr:hypothetical protein [Kitasatospora sp. NA04385]QKW18593.1 hypothetical protein HUT16_05520 [Kitasatospora sp. NA04385]
MRARTTPVPTERARSRVAATLAVSLLLALLCACAGPNQYYAGSGTHGVTTAEAVGEWVGADDTRLTLREDGTALIEHLDGLEFDFDEGWRLSGTGAWQFDDRESGQQLVLDLTTQTSSDTRPGATTAPTGSPGPSRRSYRWRFELKRDRAKKLVLFFFYGDPDSGNTNVLARPAGTAPSASPTAR